MREQRSPVVVAAALCSVLLAACATANPGWTYQPAPPVTPAPSAEASAEPSASAGAGPSASAGAEPSASAGAGSVAISALGIAFERAAVSAPAGEPLQIVFANNDAATPHNVAIRRDNPSGEEVFKGEIFDGVATQTYDVPALDAGTYAFICTVHPNMVGTLTAE